MVCDGLVVAAGTLRHEGYGAIRLDETRRAWRRGHGLTDYPPLVIVSRALTLDPALPALSEAPVRPYVITCAGAPADVRAALAEVAEVLVYGETEVDLVAARSDLYSRGIAHLLCEGGPHLLGGLTAVDLVDELCLTLSPVLVGAGPGRISAGAPSPKARRLGLRHILGEADMLLLRYAR
jgi:riboflavin biosynthesis pyrimidine reductase